MRSTITTLLFLLLSLTSILQGQTNLTITDTSQTYSNLTGYTVTMTGKSELHLTAAAPLSSCVVNLNSEDSWLFLEAVKPSTVAASYLGQIKVNGSTAVNGNNIRVVQYINGTVVIPHSSSYTPLLVSNNYNCSGTTMSLGLYTYYAGPSLGSYDNNISSFRLKRGYMATFANNADGTGHSRVFIAQDADLVMNVIPEKLDNEVSFIRVLPWRWVNKKGWCGSDAGAFSSLNCSWSYNWDNAASSTIDAEYVPMRSKRWWNSWSNITSKTNSTHALGFNEPDSLDQHSSDGGVITTDNAIEMWPNLLASGLRLGSPATTDGRLDWLYEFIDKADALDYRVDFVAVHFYKGGWTASQLYNWLRDIHVRTGRPLWVTEFNNGANWTCCEPTLSGNASTIDSFLTVLDNAPFVERYAIYNWVGDTRMMIDGSGNITPAGVVYRDNIAPAAYATMPNDGSGRSSWYKFNDNTSDALGYGNNAIAKGSPAYTTGYSGKALAFDGSDDYVIVPAGLTGDTDFSFAAWVYWNGSGQWQRIFDFGRNTNAYMLLTPRSGTNTLRFAITTGSYGSEQVLERAAQLTTGQWQHIAITLSGNSNTAKLYVNGSLAVTNNNITIDPADLQAINCYLGKSMFATDPYFNGRLDDVKITNYVLSDAEIAALATGSTANTPPAFTAYPLTKKDAAVDRYYIGSLAFDTGDLNTDTRPTFTKISGPAWLTVGGGGAVVGTPTITDTGINSFQVRATDSFGAYSDATMTINVDGYSPDHRYNLDSNASDSRGGSNGTTAGGPAFVSGKIAQAIDLDGTDDHVILPKIFADTTDFTFAVWVYWDASGSWQRIFDFGAGTNSYMFLTPSSGSVMRYAITTFGTEQRIDGNSALPTGQWCHVAVTLSGSVGKLYLNGSQVGVNTAMTIRPKDIVATKYYLGRSQFASDPYFNGKLDDIRIFNYALPQASIAKLAAGSGNTAPAFASNSISSNAGQEDSPYSEAIPAKISHYGFDLEGDTLTYTKLAGPAWLSVATNGSLSGTPTDADTGNNSFTVKCQDNSGLNASAILTVNIANIYSGTNGMTDFAALARQWLTSNCSDTPACNGTDLNGDQAVDIADLNKMAQKWLE